MICRSADGWPASTSGMALLAWVAALAFNSSTCSASSAVVPDDYSDVQTALAVGVDTVIVRTVAFREDITISGGVVVIGVDAENKPEIGRVTIQPTDDPGEGAKYIELHNLAIADGVVIANHRSFATLVFKHCGISGGISDVSTRIETASITLLGCSIDGNIRVFSRGACVVDSCVVRGTLFAGDSDLYLTVLNSRFDGLGSGHAIEGPSYGGMYKANITSNVIRGYRRGIIVGADIAVRISDNNISDCIASGIDGTGGDIVVTGNIVSRCGFGIIAGGEGAATVQANRISDSTIEGLWVSAYGPARVDSNVVWGAAENGIRVRGGDYFASRISNNTSCLNGGSGLVVDFVPTSYLPPPVITGNVSFGNATFGSAWPPGLDAIVGCNDWFGNGLGMVNGREPAATDFSADPLFCNSVTGDFHLQSGSSLLNRDGCGMVGALGGGCNDTVTTEANVVSFIVERMETGIQVTWELRRDMGGDAVWLERALSAIGPWSRPPTERTYRGAATVELDRSASGSGPFWYRLVEGGSQVVIAEPTQTRQGRPLGFRLIAVSPNPAFGPMNVEFELALRAHVDIEVFDVLGRSVGSLGRGTWPAGRHSVQWPERSKGGRALSGIYFIRYRFPGGEDVRRVVRSQ